MNPPETTNEAQPIEAVFHYCPRCGTANEKIGSVPFRCGHCRLTSFFGPVAAVGALVCDQDRRLLLVQRARDPGKGCWGLPGGFVDRDETIEHALAREVREETQLRITTANLLMTYPNSYDYQGVVAPVIDLFFCCDVESRDQIQLQSTELQHHVWVHPTAEYLDNMAFESNRIAIEYWLTTLNSR